MVDALMAQPRAAVDTESNSLYTYHEQVCLIQISIPGTNYLVDPLALDDLDPLAPFFHSLDVEKVLHAADYDLMVLQRDFGFSTRAIYDTMWAARVLGWPKVGLADILASFFDVQANKRFQRYDWGRRPLHPDALTYAWMDSYYLLPLREIQKAELETTGRWEEAQEIFDYLTSTVDAPPEDSTARHFWRLKGVHALSTHEQRKLYGLFMWRERTAEALDHPPVKVISNANLMRPGSYSPEPRRSWPSAVWTLQRDTDPPLWRRPAADHTPKGPAQIARIPGVVCGCLRTLERFKTLKSAQGVAQVRGVDSDVILPNAAFVACATSSWRRRPSNVSGIGPSEGLWTGHPPTPKGLNWQMKITFLGGVGTVTGSMYLVRTNAKAFSWTVDSIRGQENLSNVIKMPFDIRRLDAVVLSHAHIGQPSKTCPNGILGSHLSATQATVSLCEVDALILGDPRVRCGVREPAASQEGSAPSGAALHGGRCAQDAGTLRRYWLWTDDPTRARRTCHFL